MKRLICFILSFILIYSNGFGQVFSQGSDTFHMVSILQKKGYKGTDVFSYYTSQKRISYPWKMHIYSYDLDDYIEIANHVLPYLQHNDIEHKCLGFSDQMITAIDDMQAGKAFTIYPKNQKDFEKIATDLEHILADNNLHIVGADIYGDAPLGETGRIFYRYDMKTKYYLSLDEYRHNDGSYLAPDMGIEDDPFHNFNPANKSRKTHIKTIKELKEINFTLHGDDRVIIGKDFEGLKNTDFIDKEQLLLTREGSNIRVENIGKHSVYVNGHKLPGYGSVSGGTNFYYLTDADTNLKILLPSADNLTSIETALKKYQLVDMQFHGTTAIKTNGQIIKNFFGRIRSRVIKAGFRGGVTHNLVNEVPKEVRAKYRNTKFLTYLGPIVAVALLVATNKNISNTQSPSFAEIKKNIEGMVKKDPSLKDSDKDDLAIILSYSDPSYLAIINKSDKLLTKQLEIAEMINPELENQITETIINTYNKQANLNMENQILKGLENYESKT